MSGRVRCDQGGENTEVAQYILCHPRRGTGRGLVIVGKSVQSKSGMTLKGRLSGSFKDVL